MGNKHYSSPTYSSWQAMKNRTLNPRATDYKYYGGRGIEVCERWLKYFSFLEDMGERPIGHTLDRVDNNGNYEPGNCRWATRKEQANNMSTNRSISYLGQNKTLSQWAEEYGVDYMLLFSRLKLGWAMEEALNRRSRASPLDASDLRDIETMRRQGVSVNKIAKKYHIHKSTATGVLVELGIYQPLRQRPLSSDPKK